MGKISLESPVLTKTEPTKVNTLPPTESDISVQIVSDRIMHREEPTDLDIDIIKMKKHLGIEYTNSESDGKIKKIIEWGKLHGIENDDLVAEIKKTEVKIGRSWEPKERIAKLYTYLTIHEQMSELAHKLSALEL